MKNNIEQSSASKHEASVLSPEKLSQLFTKDYFFFKQLPHEIVLDRAHWPQLKKILGGKGLGLAIMSALFDERVPQGYTLPTTLGQEIASNNYRDLPIKAREIIRQATQVLTDERGSKFANLQNPLLLAVRSGAENSMPGAMDTILYVGINDSNFGQVSETLGEQETVDAYYLFCFGWAASWLNLKKDELEARFASSDKMASIEKLRVWLNEKYQIQIPQNSWDQLESAVLAVFQSYDSPAAVNFRHHRDLQVKQEATAVNVMPMVHANQGQGSGIGVVFSHDPKTAQPKPQIQFVSGGVGDAVVSGEGDHFQESLIGQPKLQRQLENLVESLAQVWGDEPVDVEFAIENGKLFLLQCRDLKLTSPATLRQIIKKYDSDFVHQNIRQLISPELVASLGQAFTPESLENAQVITQGQPIGQRAHVGKVATSLEQAAQLLKQKQSVVLVLPRLPDATEILNLHPQSGDWLAVVTSTGSPNSHAANVLNAVNVAGAIGCPNLEKLSAGQLISVDGQTGQVYEGQLTLAQPYLEPAQKKLVEARKSLGLSFWESIVQHYDLSSLQSQHEVEIINLMSDFLLDHQPQSAKALTQEIINHLFPPELTYSYQVISTSDLDYKNKIRQLAKDGWAAGYDVSLRSAFKFPLDESGEKFGKNPWIVLKPGQDKRLENFLEGSLPSWKYGGLTKWEELASTEAGVELTEILVGHIHHNKMDLRSKNRHGVGVARSSGYPPLSVDGDIILNTPHLRSFEESAFDPNKNVTYKLNLANDQLPFRLGFGRDHLDREKTLSMVHKLLHTPFSEVQLNFSPAEKAVRRELFRKLGIDVTRKTEAVQALELSEVVEIFQQMIESAAIPNEMLEKVVVGRSWTRINQLMEQVQAHIVEVSPAMAAIENAISARGGAGGLSLEFQAGFDLADDLLMWWSIYGLKGLEEWLLGQMTG